MKDVRGRLRRKVAHRDAAPDDELTDEAVAHGVSEALVQWRGYPSSQGKSDGDAWWHAVEHGARRAYERLRMLKRRQLPTVGNPDAYEAVADEEQDLRALLVTAVDALPADLADLMRLVYWDGYCDGGGRLAADELAEHLGVSRQTVRSRYNRAMTLLRDALSDELPSAA